MGPPSMFWERFRCCRFGRWEREEGNTLVNLLPAKEINWRIVSEFAPMVGEIVPVSFKAKRSMAITI